MKRVTSVFIIAVLATVAVSAKVIATVNGYPITLKEANAFVKKVTKGQATYYKLKPEDRKRVIRAVATDKLIVKNAARELDKNQKDAAMLDLYVRKYRTKLLKEAKKKLSKREKEQAYANLWLMKMSSGIKVTESELKKVYKKNKKAFKDPKTKKVAPYSRVKPLIKMQLKQQKYVQKLMKRAKIDYNPKTAKKK